MSEEAKYVLRAHGSDLYLEVNDGYLPFRREVVKEAERVFCVSQNGADYMKKNYASALQTPIIVSRLGTSSLSPLFTRKDLQPDNQLHLVSCAHLSRVKRVDIIVSALKLLGDANPSSQIFWTHIGGGDLFDDIKKMSYQLPKNIIVAFMGYMDNQSILEFYANNNFELFINSSESEGIPVTFMEAMSFTIPVMAPAVGGIAEIVNDENGFLLPKEINSTILYEALQAVLKDKQVLADKSAKARESWQEKYNAEKNYRDFSNSLKKIILESKTK
jgi:glycosyltransferase involved in cell wall biosynthesis